MIALFALLTRLIFIFLVARFVWSLFFRKKNTIPPGRKKEKASTKRFDAKGENIADGDFRDLH